MQDIVEQTPSERDERIYAQWESGKTLRVLARQFEVSIG
jgi:Mor family transcriptional regulator